MISDQQNVQCVVILLEFVDQSRLLFKSKIDYNKNDVEPFNDRELERLLKSFKKDPKGNILKMFENVLKNVLECPKK